MYDYFYGAEAEQFFFYRIPKVLFTEERFRSVSAEAKVLYGLLLDRMSLSCKNGWLDQTGRVYIIFTIDEVMTALGCADQKAGKLLHELESKCRLIERKRQGLGKPNLIYVKNFVDNDVDIQRDMPETGNSVDIDPLLIALLRSGADGWLAVIFIPVIHPITKPHIRFYLEGGDLGVLLPKPFQLFHAFRLCFCQDAFLLCLSVFIVAHDVTAFPPSVASQADSTLTVFAFPCHVITPSLQSHS